jgi:hypothetical protein
MLRNTWWGKTLRIIGIVFMGITALFTLASGIGTTCVALNPTGFGGSMAALAPFQGLYVLFVLVTTAIGIMAARAVFLLSKSRPNSYRYALIALILGIVVGAIHMAVSRGLRGKSMPVDGVVYTTVLTLIIFLILRIPKIWQGVDFETPEGDKQTGKEAAAITLIFTGMLTLIIQFLMAPTHTFNGINYADVWHTTMTLTGMGQILGGVGLVFLSSLPVSKAIQTGFSETTN